MRTPGRAGGKRKASSIRARLIRTVMAGTAVVVVLCFVGVYLSIRLGLQAGLSMGLVADAGGLALMTQRVGDRIAMEFDPARVTIDFGPSAHAAYFQIWSYDGTVIARSPSLGTKNLARPKIAQDDITLEEAILPDGRRGIVSAISWVPRPGRPAPGAPPDADPGKETGVVIAVASGTEAVDGPLRRLLALLLGAAALLLACLWGVVRRGIRRGLGPLDELGQRVTKIEPNRLNERLDPEPLPAELQPIAGTLNDLLSRLERAFDRERQFTANAAHELRTPIAEVRTMAEVAVRYPQPAATNVETLRGIAQVAAQMDRMISSLLALSRDTLSRERREIAPCDAAELLGELLAARAEPIARRRLGVAMGISAALPFETDRARLASVLGNLLDNAIEYTAEGGSVRVNAEGEDGGICVEIENGPMNLAPDDLPHLFDPFWRKEQTASESGHAGLGLALVKASVEALGGAVRAELPTAERCAIEIRIPAAKGAGVIER